MKFTKVDFIRESNRIEGIHREPTIAEVTEYDRFMGLKEVTIDDLKQFVGLYQPQAILRDKVGLDVRVGTHLPPAGGPKIKMLLGAILHDANKYCGKADAYRVHCDYEILHPFTDGNGRSGRMLWMWMMRDAPLGFLHTWYYQSLSNARI